MTQWTGLVIGALWTGLVLAGATGCDPVGVCSDDAAKVHTTPDCGIWVSTSLGKDTNSGSRDSPVASLSQAIELARYNHPHRVYACGETWTEPVILPASIWLFGGFDCKNGWRFRGDGWRARLETGPDQIPITTDGVGDPIVISDFTIRAGNATVPGGSSIGVFIPDDVAVTIRRSEIIPGNGADGLNGDSAGDPLPDGAPGNAGGDACGPDSGKGGPSPEAACGATPSKGGKGGDGGNMAADGEPGAPDPKDPNNPLLGAGGKAQTAAANCTQGKNGVDGADGAAGHGANSSSGTEGRLTKAGFEGSAGEDGKPGAPGQGGGGGGGSLTTVDACGGVKPGGAGGGSGGVGGCGGAGGKGGRPGGASFAVASRSTQLVITRSKLWVGYGGKGGDGGAGQKGGSGGAPGHAGIGQGSVAPACPGGWGGRGGDGGPGGGGRGGHAIAVASIKGGNPQLDDETSTALSAGAPGAGGASGPSPQSSMDAQGAPGLDPSGRVVNLDP